MRPQSLKVSVDRKGSLSVQAVASQGTPDTPFSPVATAAESDKLKLDIAAELQAAFEANDFLKPGAKSPEKAMQLGSYVYGEVGSEFWDRKD